jgi:uncharacterized protein (DUF1501 family)
VTTTRRTFLREAACGLGATAFLSAFERFSRVDAATGPATDYRALVCVFLFGGNDGNNMVVPYDGYADYATVRGATLNIPKASLHQVAAASQGATFGLHPSLTELASLYEKGQLAVLCNVGTLAAPVTRSQYLAGGERPDSLFSHSDQQAQWQSSVVRSAGAGDAAPTGWGGRTADAAADLNSGSFPMIVSVSGVPLFATGVRSRPLVPGSGLQGFPNTPTAQARLAALRQILAADADQTLVGAASRIASSAIDDSAVLNAALSQQNALATTFPGTSLGRQLFEIAKILAARSALKVNRQIFFASLGGFDTHTDELNTQQSLLTQVSQAMSAFYAATVELGIAPGVATFTLSDFGRTLKPASGGGTDHAWGSHHLVMGGSVRGGNFYGTFPDLGLGGPDDTSKEGRWIPTTSVDEYGATLARWYGVDPAALATVFPNLGRFAKPDLGFLAS